MYFVKQDQDNRDAVELIEEVLKSHIKLKEAKDLELMHEDEVYKSCELKKEIETLEAQISGIIYTYDYVRLMLSFKGKNEKFS